MTDASSRVVEQWFDLQVALWQPWTDWHAAAMLAWAGPWVAVSTAPWVYRGQEQLA